MKDEVLSITMAWWQSGLMRKTRNLVPSGASVRIRPTSITFAVLLVNTLFFAPLSGKTRYLVLAIGILVKP